MIIMIVAAAALIIGLVIWQKDQERQKAGASGSSRQLQSTEVPPASPPANSAAPSDNRVIVPAPAENKPANPKNSDALIPEPQHSYTPPPQSSEQTLEQVDRDKAYAGFPKPAGDAYVRILQNRAYVVGYSEERKNPLWVAYKLVPQHLPINYKRPKSFNTDTRTLARVRDSDYRNSGYQRGHMAPNSPIADCFGPEAQKETFLLSNITPQTPALNEKVWENMERAEATRYSKNEPVWIICGPMFSARPNTLKNGVQIADDFYRIVVRERANKPEVMAFDVPQTVAGDEPPSQFLTSVRAIEKKSQLDFMWELPDDVENKVETQKTGKVWDN